MTEVFIVEVMELQQQQAPISEDREDISIMSQAWFVHSKTICLQ